MEGINQRRFSLDDGVFYGCHSLISINLTSNRIQNLTEGWLFGLNNVQTM